MTTTKEDIIKRLAEKFDKKEEVLNLVMNTTFKYMKEEIIEKKEEVCFIRLGRLGNLCNSFDMTKQAMHMTSGRRKEYLRKKVDYMCENQDLSRVYAVPLVYAVAFFILKSTTYTRLYKRYYELIEKISYVQNTRMAKYFKGDS